MVFLLTLFHLKLKKYFFKWILLILKYLLQYDVYIICSYLKRKWNKYFNGRVLVSLKILIRSINSIHLLYSDCTELKATFCIVSTEQSKSLLHTMILSLPQEVGKWINSFIKYTIIISSQKLCLSYHQPVSLHSAAAKAVPKLFIIKLYPGIMLNYFY